MSAIDQGFAIRRNGSCLAGVEVDCGTTVAPYHGCCPTGYVCPHQYNTACCSPGQNCTDTLASAPQPRCANATWDLFDNQGLFCCEHGQPGYSRQNTDGCAVPGMQFQDGDSVLSTVRVGATATPSASSSSSSSLSSSSSSSSSSPSSNSSSTPIGAIVGGVVGGVIFITLAAALLWFLLHRRKQKRVSEYADPMQTKHQLDANQAVHEADATSSSVKYRHELPVHGAPVEQAPVELLTETEPHLK